MAKSKAILLPNLFDTNPNIGVPISPPIQINEPKAATWTGLRGWSNGVSLPMSNGKNGETQPRSQPYKNAIMLAEKLWFFLVKLIVSLTTILIKFMITKLMSHLLLSFLCFNYVLLQIISLKVYESSKLSDKRCSQ